MSNTSSEKLSTVPVHTSVKTRKPYHAPKLENYGAVSELTRSGGAATEDNVATYSSVG